ncbi:MAG: ribbon-helix-helix protein, CopG family [Proteobacteria bacterium]|nr:ribbon-helix-helix protein, CopG family [Pseudomonadota bacterium]
MPRTTATFSVSVPPEMAAELERVRKAEHRTRSELIREALRHYIRAASVRSVSERLAALPEAEAAPDEIAAIAEGRRQFRAGKSIALRHGLDRRAQRPRAKKP